MAAKCTLTSQGSFPVNGYNRKLPSHIPANHFATGTGHQKNPDQTLTSVHPLPENHEGQQVDDVLNDWGRTVIEKGKELISAISTKVYELFGGIKRVKGNPGAEPSLDE